MPRTARRSFRHRITGKRGTPLAKRPGAHPLNASLYSLVSFSILVPRAARRSFELKDQASAARRTLQRMRPRAPPHDCSVVCFCIQCGRAADRAENFPKKGKRARCTRQLMRSRAPALKTVSHISGSPATAVPRFGRRRFLNNSSIERGAPCNARASPLKAAISPPLRTAVPRAEPLSCGRTHADALPRVSVELPMGSRTV